MKKGSSRKSASPKKTSSASPSRRPASPTNDSNNIPLDGGSTPQDYYTYSATNMIQRLVTSYTTKFDTSFVTSYLLSLMLEALVPTAPEYAKEQAQHQLSQMGGAVGVRETVELVKFVQAAGRINNELLVANGQSELERLNEERQIQFAVTARKGKSGSASPRRDTLTTEEAASTTTADDAAAGFDDDDDGVWVVPGIRGSIDTKIVPAASTNAFLQKKCLEQGEQLASQAQRIHELEATLASHRPVFEAVAQMAALEEKPDMMIKAAQKKGTVVKKGKGSVAFIDENATPATTAASPLPPKIVRYEPTRDEVIASARSLAADARAASRAKLGIVPSSTYAQSAAPLSPPPAGASTASWERPLFSPPPTSFINVTGYMHQHVGASSTTSDAYRHLGEPPLMVSSMSLRGYTAVNNISSLRSPDRSAATQQQQQVSALSTTVGGVPTTSTVMDALPLSQPLLNAQDVVRLISDKRPLSVQSAEIFSARYQIDQQQRAKMLLDYGESSIVSAVQNNCALSSRLSGACHALALQREYSRLNRSTAAAASSATTSMGFGGGAAAAVSQQNRAPYSSSSSAWNAVNNTAGMQRQVDGSSSNLGTPSVGWKL